MQMQMRMWIGNVIRMWSERKYESGSLSDCLFARYGYTYVKSIILLNLSKQFAYAVHVNAKRLGFCLYILF